jgi:hypothetical protein
MGGRACRGDPAGRGVRPAGQPALPPPAAAAGVAGRHATGLVAHAIMPARPTVASAPLCRTDVGNGHAGAARP